MTGYVAYLRVYEPLAAFTDAERARWQDYADGAPSRPVLMAREHEAAVAATLSTPPRLEVCADHDGYVRHLDGLTYVCPLRLQVRTWEALADFRSGLPDELSAAFVPPHVAEAAEMAYDGWLAAHPDDKVGIRSATWQVPVPWLVLFEPDERRLVLGERRSVGAAPAQTGLDRALVYLTAISRARRRAAKALAVVRRAFADGPAVDALEDVARWLEEFHPHALVELDYGGLVHLLDDDDLAADASVARVNEALEELGRGDVEAAGRTYAEIVAHWRRLASFEHAN
jgi:hypothetical protein